MPWGCVSDERLAERAFKVASPPDPHCGSGSLWVFRQFRRANPEWRAHSISGPLGPGSIKITWDFVLTYSAWCLPSCLVRRWSLGRLIAAPTAKADLVRDQRAGEDTGPYV